MKVVPGILTQEYNILHEQYSLVKQVVSWVQYDVVDGKFVQAKATVQPSDIPEGEFDGALVEAHLMVENPHEYIEECKRLGIKRMIVHYEAIQERLETIHEIKQAGMQVSVALNPGTSASYIEDIVDDLDALLLMTIHPGKQGQDIIMDVLSKVQEIRVIAPDIIIGIDGGVKVENIELVAQYALDYVVVGSGIWLADDPLAQIEQFREKISHVRNIE